jgi:hypothetical protein
MTQSEDRPRSPAVGAPRNLSRFLPILFLVTLAVAAASMAAAVDIDQVTVIDSAIEWDDPSYIISANVTVADGGRLFVNGSTLSFEAAEGVLVGITVEAGGELVLEGVVATAPSIPYFITSDGSVVMRGTDLDGLYTTFDEESIVGMLGGIVANAGSLTLENVAIDGEGVGISAFDCNLEAVGLTITGSGYGILAAEVDASIVDANMSGQEMALGIMDSTLHVADSFFDDVNMTLWAMNSQVTVVNLTSFSDDDHLIFENCTSSIRGSYIYDGGVGAMAVIGYMDIEDSYFGSNLNSIELLYAEGRVVDTLVEGSADMSIVLSFIGYSSEEPDFEFDNVTVRDAAEAAIDIEGSANLLLTNVTIEGCGDGINVGTSTVVIRDSLVTESTQCRPWGCSYKATGTGVLVETSGVDLYDVTIANSNGPAVSSYFSYVNATRSAFKDSNGSGLLLVYSSLKLVESEVTGNGWWGVESLGFDIDPASLDATWGNTLADIRMNMTINAKVVDQFGMWLSHAEVTASSDDLVVGPYYTGFGGSTPTYELAIMEWTDGSGEVDYNPWTFTVEYGNFTNSTDVVMQLGLAQITLIVDVHRADLTVDNVKAPTEVDRDQQVTVRARVINQGNATVQTVILTFYYRDSNGFQRVIGEAVVGPLGPGDSQEGSTTWAPDTKGDYMIVAVVDVDDVVDEEDDDNNRAQRAMKVDGDSANAPGPGAIAALAVLTLAGLVSANGRRRRQ